MQIKELNKITTFLDNTEKMPVLFLGHGSPMNAIEENEFVQGFRDIKKKFRSRMLFFASVRIGKPAVPF